MNDGETARMQPLIDRYAWRQGWPALIGACWIVACGGGGEAGAGGTSVDASLGIDASLLGLNKHIVSPGLVLQAHDLAPAHVA